MESATPQQDAMMMEATPQKEHKWLQQLVGEWTCEAEVIMGPDQPAEKSTGSENVRSLGDLWIISEGGFAMPDGKLAVSEMTLGYDPDSGRFVGTFIASMTTYLWVYDGELDAEGKVLTLSAEGPDWANPGKKAKYRDVIEIKSADHRVFSSHLLGADGTWQEFLRSDVRRVK